MKFGSFLSLWHDRFAIWNKNYRLRILNKATNDKLASAPFWAHCVSCLCSLTFPRDLLPWVDVTLLTNSSSKSLYQFYSEGNSPYCILRSRYRNAWEQSYSIHHWVVPGHICGKHWQLAYFVPHKSSLAFLQSLIKVRFCQKVPMFLS